MNTLTQPIAAELDLSLEDLEPLVSPDDSADFFKGVAIGLAIVALWT